jgi:uncharacterized membrane protein
VKTVLASVRRYLLTGLIVAAPVGVTIVLLAWAFRELDAILGQYLPPLLGVAVPGLGLVVLLAALLVIGWISHRALGKRVLYGWNDLLSRVPVVRKVYGTASQVIQSVLDRDEKLFQACAMMEYPTSGSYALVFITARAPREMEEPVGKEMLTVFLPTFPNPTTGYLMQVPTDGLTPLPMSVEDGFQLVISAGAALPGGQERRRGLDLERLFHEDGVPMEEMIGSPGEGPAPEGGGGEER